MSIPKQDERTPGLEFERLPGGYTLAEWQDLARRDDCLKRMVQSDLRQLLGIIERQRNAYGSTDALRSALTEAKAALTTIRAASLKGVSDGYGKPEYFADELYRSHGDVHRALIKIDAALSGSPAPSTEGLREALAPILSLPDACVESLRHQRQVDADGCEVGVSRQAVDEIYAAIVAARTALAGVTAPSEVDAK